MTYMAQVRHHLAESRKRGLPFERAWREAMEAHPRPESSHYGYAPHVMRQAERWFREGYYGRPLPGPDMRGIVGALDDAREADGLSYGRQVA